MIFAGDFAQLPPAMGGESVSLYGSCDGMYASSKQSQEMAMGKAIWHQVTTVVILRQNMRQTLQTPDDDRISGHRGAPKITDKEFQNVSIITGLNVHKDEYNRLSAIRFAEETGQELVAFYSEDHMSIVEDDKCQPRGKGVHSNIMHISDYLQGLLWEAMPLANDKLLPPVLYLCKGMPVMIRLNSATELCITKGQEGVVYGWKDIIGSRGKRVLEVLFVSLTTPPTEVRIPGLLTNVIPLMQKSITVSCSLPDDTIIKVSCSQVHVLPNFSMTDFSSQGKTRVYNLIDLNNC
ncbi:hypothetical protein ARMSODRAFT_898636 [Armillaria solidipes]|uniref:DNA helicase n=1 Tax=Armillaria solidipes TaxID=1076256 RepID=A0A2H3ATC4_9AGAR|nr:hypothetical protein ARMSODRAFT_898636 [Armillaria solidipes]